MKKILLLIAADRVGGPSRQILQLIEHCDKDKYDIHIGCTFLGGECTEFIQEVKKMGIRLHVLYQKQSLDPTPIVTVYRIIKHERFDILQTHGYKAAVIGCVVKWVTRIPWISFLHGHTTENRKMSWYFALEFHLVKLADRIVAVSEEMRSRLVKRGLPATKTSVIHNALDPKQFESIGVGDKVSREVFGITRDEKLVGVVGRFSSEKGQDIFLEAFRIVVMSHDSVKAMLIGEGLMEEQLRKYCLVNGLRSKVIFTGYQKNIAQFYPLFDLLVLPSRSEGLPNVALESLHFGVPVVATSVGGTPEVIKNGITGVLVKSEDPNDLAQAIIKVLSDDQLRKSFVSNGYDCLINDFSPEIRAKKIRQLYSDLSSNVTSKGID